MASSGKLLRSLMSSLSGGAVPALVGVLATIVANKNASGPGLLSLLAAWTVVGYLSLSDFGLTRASSTLVSSGTPAAVVHRRLSGLSLKIGAALTGLLVCGLSLMTWRTGPESTAVLWVLAPMPVLTCYQFPLVGALEAEGRFALVAAHKVLSAVTTYLVPAVLVSRGTGGLAAGLVLMVLYRALAVVVLGLIVRQGSDPLISHDPAGAGPNVRSLVTWVGASSVLGPLLLYVDRGFAGASSSDAALVVLYISVSEILIRTYILPTSVMSVVFPLTVRSLQATPARVRKAYIRDLPLALLGVILMWCGLAATVSESVLTSVLPQAGLQEHGKWLVLILVAGTIVSWSSQAQIGYLQALGRHRSVVVVQAGMAAPYLGLLWVAAGQGILAIAAAWCLRIVAMAIALWCLARTPSQRRDEASWEPSESSVQGAGRRED